MLKSILKKEILKYYKELKTRAIRNEYLTELQVAEELSERIVKKIDVADLIRENIMPNEIKIMKSIRKEQKRIYRKEK